MDNIYIDYEQGTVLGQKIQNEANDLIDLLNNMKEIQEKLEPVLNDSNDKKYLKFISSGMKIMNKLAETVNETGNFLVNVSNAYEEAANTNCGNIN